MYREVEFDKIAYLIEKAILVVTATDLETRKLHESIKAIEKDEKILTFVNGGQSYFLGIFGSYYCFHVQCGTMGSIGAASSIITVRDAIRILKPKITIMIGIAFGIDDGTQEIGDVLVASSIVPYNFKKITPEGEELRSTAASSSNLLLNRFRNVIDWEFPLSTRNAQKIISPVFSGEELINNIDRRRELEKINPTAKGGEMEGAGLYAAADGMSECILVKGICDFADGNKDVNKEGNQLIAMDSAISICLEVFSSVNSFGHIGLFPASPRVPSLDPVTFDHKLVNDVLFDIYDSSKEEFYAKRRRDVEISTHLNYYSLWVSGKSGRGKSIALMRNLILEKIDFIPVTLASCVGLVIDDFFYEIYAEIKARLEPQEAMMVKSNYQNSVREINRILLKYFYGKTVFLFIDEIPISDDGKFSEFVNLICSLFISSSLQTSEVKIRYALSSIYAPERHIRDVHVKVRNHVKFFSFEDWDPGELFDLIGIAESKLNIQLSSDSKERIVIESGGSPRFVKAVLRNSVILGGVDDDTITIAIGETKSQGII